MRHVDPEIRFWQKVDLDFETGCWPWKAHITKLGYGSFYPIHGKNVKAHRFAYELVNGKIPSGLELDHLCRNRSCVNPKHLEAVTHKENIMRGLATSSINAKKTHCMRGHPLSGDNLYITSCNGSRQCQVCRKNRSSKYWRNHAKN